MTQPKKQTKHKNKALKSQSTKPRLSPRPWLLWDANLLRRYFKAVAATTILLFIIFISYCFYDLPDASILLPPPKRPSITIKANDGTILAQYGDIYGQDLTYEEIPTHLHDALIATEDRRFYSHPGVDIIGILRALCANLMAEHIVQGGSTITQQLAKIAFLSPEKSLKRKVQEAILAVELESKYSKQEIMALYLNRTYFGQGVYGIDGAARHFFGKYAQDLSLYESALLVGMLKAPARYVPNHNLEAALARARQVLNNMFEVGYISERDIFYAEPPQPIYYGEARGVLRNPYFTDYVLEELRGILGTIRQDLEVYTTLNLDFQDALESTIQNTMHHLGKSYNVDQAAAVALEKDGGISGMMGGTSYAKSQFNRAVNASRHPGSAFKFFVYLAAFEHGYQPTDQFEDKPIKIKGWSPHNISRRYDGVMDLDHAFAKSVNTVAVQLAQKVGYHNIAIAAKRLGIQSDITIVPSIALGTSEVTLLELSGAYAHILNNGYSTIPYAITKITDLDNNVLYEHQPLDNDMVLTPTVVENMHTVLYDVIRDGTGKAAYIPGYDIFGKTGTSQDYRDAYFVGSLNGDHPITVGIWAGNDDNTPTNKMTGGTLPVTIWRNFMRRANLVPEYQQDKSAIASGVFAILEEGE